MIHFLPFVLLLLLFLGCSAAGPSTHVEGGSAVVERVIDGDTIVVNIGGTVETVRLLGIDTPETVHPDRPVECFGPEASALTSALLPPGSPVGLERDREERDAFGRLLLYVSRSDGVLVNEVLVASGHAKVLVIAPNDALAPRLRAAEAQARSEGAGMWSACGP